MFISIDNGTTWQKATPQPQNKYAYLSSELAPDSYFIPITQGTTTVKFKGSGDNWEAQDISVWSTNTPQITPTPTPTPSLTPTPTPSASPCPKALLGDINCDGLVNLFDYNILVGNFGKTVPANTQGDLDGNGVVNLFDYNTLVSNFGK